MTARRTPHEAGFSLIEVMVALAILSLAGVALLNAVTQSSRATGMVQRQALAALAAENLLNQAYLDHPGRGALVADGGTYDLGGETYSWSLDLLPTGQDGMRLVVLSVRGRNDDAPIYTLRTFDVGS
ncbi:type II secretion system minor pseudopilin GspI [Woodsholea maritima]|uniref:type II secretion system minor pseudopilin GspI n=1 Tax=Woodsholea maritima TaxID=240237 RepID=UPI000376E3F8|nr:type II secretion system minor pseudopilin GspI [Woodsholea maritima]